MSSPLYPFLNSLFKSVSPKNNSTLGKALINAVVEKQLSPFKLLIKTDLGKLSINSQNNLDVGKTINFEIVKTKDGLFLKPLDEKIEISPKSIENLFKKSLKPGEKFQIEIVKTKNGVLLKPLVEKTDNRPKSFNNPFENNLQPGKKIKPDIVKTNINTALKQADEKIAIIPKNIENLIKVSPKLLNQQTIISGVVEKKIALPKFIVSTDLGKIEVESGKLLKKGDILKLPASDVKDSLAKLTTNISKELKSSEGLIKPNLKDILAIIKDNPKNLSKEIFSVLKDLPEKEFKTLKNNVLKNFINPEKISGSDVKKAVKYFWGSSSKDFKNDFMEFKDILQKTEVFEKEAKLKSNLLKNISTPLEMAEKTEKNAKGFESLKNLNLVKFAESSKLYFFLPLMGQDFESAEFFLDLEENSKAEKESKELKALIKLNMSRLGIVRADLRLLNEKIVKIFIGTESKEAMDIIEKGFKLLKVNLRKAGFKDVFLKADVLKKEELNEPLSRKLIETNSSEYVFDLRV